MKNEPITKRFVLKLTSTIFDPLGILGAFVINLKLLLQELCFIKCPWDDELNEEFCNKWKKVMNKLKSFGKICVPRYYMQGVNDVTEVELHGFADASIKAYAAVIYIRIKTKGGITTRFVSAKTRVAPLNEKKIPRLELLACFILSKLMKVVIESIKNIPFHKIVCWTDNMDSCIG